ncbi:hypothetical protein [Microbacterium sp. SORGH_AS_0888]|uniref:hypothetical protein n=1 Tax=Microbacterium sp. SORGH_AS_0888 TaxID=3041791 RepID=UPI00277D7636|nr:hypothetical protein [Microbacterium sp. SORGH_AS_0888]MDQ1128283.1 hypothetical protein [Microbacterium sp. SORGH_AS_0888]
MTTEPNQWDAAVFELLWRSNIETLPRLIREPGLPVRALHSIPGKHWADGRARVVLGVETPLPEGDVPDLVAMLATMDTATATGEPPALAGGAS